MKKYFAKSVSILLSVLILLSTSLTVLAESVPDFTLTSEQNSFYSGVTYEITAEITNLPENLLKEELSSAFDWGVSGKSNIVSTNNYQYTKNSGANTYTVTETAKFTISEAAGEEFEVVAHYQDTDLMQSKSFSVLQPITNIELECNNNESVNYVKSADGTDDRLYINMGSTAVFTANVSPLKNDDTIFVSSTRSGVIQNTQNGFEYTPGNSTKATDLNFDVKVSPSSGYKYQKNIKTTKCIPLKKFTLNTNTDSIESYNKENDNPKCGQISIIQDENLILTPKKSSPSYSNDTFDYKLYNVVNGTYTESEFLSSYMTIDSDNVCTLNIHNPGLYLLQCDNVSAGDGSLKRDLRVSVLINVIESNPSTKIMLYDVDENGDLKNEKLDTVNLYLNVGKDTHDLSQNVYIEPIGHTDGITYVSDNPSVAKIDKNTGVIAAISSGTTRVYVISDKNPSVVASVDVNVFVGISSINNIQKELSTLPAGHSEQLKAIVSPEINDDTISWSSLNPKALTVDQNGYITANENYDFGENDNVIVGVTATTRFGKTYTVYIQVVPAVRATNINISLSGPTVESLTENTYTSYTGSTLELSANATGVSGNKSNDVLLWRVATTNGNLYNLDEATNLFSTITKNTDGSYTLVSKVSDAFTFYCYGIRGGEGIVNDTVFSSIGLRSSAKATKITAINPLNNSAINSITLSGKTSTEINVSMTPTSAYTEDAFSCESSNNEICSVKKTSPQTIELHAGSISGTANITIYSKSKSKSIILKVTVNNNIAYSTITGVNEEYTYTGSKIEPAPTITSNGYTLYKNIDYTVSYSEQVNVGMAKMTIIGKGDFEGSSLELYYNIVQKDIGDGNPTNNISASASGNCSLATNNNPQAKITVKYGSIALKENVDYTVSYKNNLSAGTATAIVSGIGNYSGYIYIDYTVTDLITNAKFYPVSNQVYSGHSKTPKVKIIYNNRTLVENKDYTLSYSNNIKIGIATIKITGINNFTGSTTIKFNIVPSVPSGFKTTSQSSNSITLSWGKDSNTAVKGVKIVNASTNKVVATITDSKITSYKVTGLSPATKYTFKIRKYSISGSTTLYSPYSNNISVYTKLSKTIITKTTALKKGIKINWKTQSSKISGYQIQYSTKSNFSVSKSIYVTNYKTATKTISKLSAKKKYYVRVRSYKDVTLNNKKSRLCGSWSNTKTVTTKK